VIFESNPKIACKYTTLLKKYNFLCVCFPVKKWQTYFWIVNLDLLGKSKLINSLSNKEVKLVRNCSGMVEKIKLWK
jgi:hypothetical protein